MDLKEQKSKLSFPLIVESFKRETPSSKTITLTIPEQLQDKFKYKPGQFVSLFVENENDVKVRSYSFSSTPTQPLRQFSITVKKVPFGSVSPWLVDQISVGQTLWCSPPEGAFFKDYDQSDSPINYLLIAAGSGITPLYSMLQHILTEQSNSCVTLIDCNRNKEEIIFAHQLDELKKQHKNRFNFISFLSQPPLHWSGKEGRLDEKQLQKIYTQLNQNHPQMPVHAYLCGPDSFMKMCQKCLIDDLHVPPQQVHCESFGTTKNNTARISDSDENLETAEEGLQSDGSLILGSYTSTPDEKPQVLCADIEGELITVPSDENLSVLEVLLNAGHNPPYSCMSGACMACMAHLEEGRIFQTDLGILDNDNIKRREFLTCQARQVSEKLKINYSVI